MYINNYKLYCLKTELNRYLLITSKPFYLLNYSGILNNNFISRRLIILIYIFLFIKKLVKKRTIEKLKIKQFINLLLGYAES